MTKIRGLAASLLLASLMSVSVMAGDMQGPGIVPPPPPPPDGSPERVANVGPAVNSGIELSVADRLVIEILPVIF
jgi:hypothetical protein